MMPSSEVITDIKEGHEILMMAVRKKGFLLAKTFALAGQIYFGRHYSHRILFLVNKIDIKNWRIVIFR